MARPPKGMKALARRKKAVARPAVTDGQPWNVLLSPSMEVATLSGGMAMMSPLEILQSAASIRRVVGASPMDVFASHRFLLTLLYWVAENSKRVALLRRDLLGGRVPRLVGSALSAATDQFALFDAKRPFLQDPAVIAAKPSSPAYLFAEMATGTNVAHFDHSQDATATLCVRCAAAGLLRLVPWTQAGGAGLSPAIHGAPPIMPLAIGRNLCETLGLNLVPLDVPHGKPQWSGQFRPTSSSIRLMEALTWNPRRVHLLQPLAPALCSRCGQSALPTVGPIRFEKNDACKKDPDRVWCDPAAFYASRKGTLVGPIKSGNEFFATTRTDVRALFERTVAKKIEPAPSSCVVEANPSHPLWYVVIPCTNPANNKSYDHRGEWFTGFTGAAPAVATLWPKDVVAEAGDPRALQIPRPVAASAGAVAFVRAASALDAAAWSVLGNARSMHDDPAAFDLFTAIYWPLRQRYTSAPCRPAAWLGLKLMANAGRLRPSARSQARSTLQPWTGLRLHQPEARSADGRIRKYPARVPRGDRLESELTQIIGRFVKSRSASGVDWPGTCQFLHEVLS